MNTPKKYLAIALALASAGCASTPDLPKYKAQLAADFANAAATKAEPVAEFWRGFSSAVMRLRNG